MKTPEDWAECLPPSHGGWDEDDALEAVAVIRLAMAQAWEEGAAEGRRSGTAVLNWQGRLVPRKQKPNPYRKEDDSE